MALLLDTGVLYAAADRKDRWHLPVRRLLEGLREPLLVPSTVPTEVCYLIRQALGFAAESSFLRDLGTGRYALVQLTATDALRAADLIQKYKDLPLDFVDASIVAMAERLGVTKIATTDRRDFSLVRPAHCEKFELSP
ncbi:MAG: PIN domain-containing protein [Bdellovibrionota bacterium]